MSPDDDGRGASPGVSHETQVGLLPWFGRAFLAPRLKAVNQAMFDDLARAVSRDEAL